MVLQSNIAKIPYFEPDDEPALDVFTEDTANALDPLVIPRFATVAARDTAYASLIAAGKRGMKCFVDSQNSWCGYDGTGWRWEEREQAEYNWGGSLTTGVNSTTLFQLPGFDFVFTPSITGWADVYLDTDALQITKGFGNASVSGYLNGVLLVTSNVLYDNDSDTVRNRLWKRCITPKRRLLYAGETHTIRTYIQNEFGTGLWQIPNIAWRVVQQ